MDCTAFFSADYASARESFRNAAQAIDCRLSTYHLAATGPRGEALAVDVAVRPGRNADHALVLSSGLHGVEGFFGSAVQLALLHRWRNDPQSAPAARCIMIHALNPYGFAWRRRVNEDNVDINRNLLTPGERYEGCPEGYRVLDALLNPRRPPAPLDLMFLKSMVAIARYGMPALRQAIAAGQYEYPRGLFYGGAAPCATNDLLMQHFDEWLAGGERVIHLDFHSGLGRHATYKLLIDYPVDAAQRERMVTWFGRGTVEVSDSARIAYSAKGNFGRWCASRSGKRDYTYAAAEFGTYGALRVLSGLRTENQAHHWGKPDASSTLAAKAALVELFCPASTQWRRRATAQSLQLVDRAAHALAE